MSGTYEMQKQRIAEKEREKGRMLALGFFDCLHRGHREIVSRMLSVCELCNLEPHIFTFDDDFFEALGSDTRLVYLLEERLELFEEAGILRKNTLIASPSADFLEISADDFLAMLDGYKLSAVIAGEDFRFGKGAAYGMDDLEEWARSRGILAIRQPLLKEWDRKISSSDIREYLAMGEVAAANALLGRRYFVEGSVLHGRGVGKSFGLPTANLTLSPEKLLPFDGVYETRTVVDGVKYRSVTNVGTCPTFGETVKGVETHIIGFDGDVYGKKIRVEFVDRIRSIFRFDSKEELKRQIESDVRRVTESDD